MNNAIKIIESMGWRDVDLPRLRYPERHVEPQVVSLENESIKGERLHIFNTGAIAIWKRLTQSLMNRLDRLKAKIEKKKGFYSRYTGSFIIIAVIMGSLRGSIQEIKKGRPILSTESIIMNLLLIIIPLIYAFYIYIYEKPVFLVRKRDILTKILAEKEDKDYTKSPVQQALESYLEETAVRPGDVDPWGGRHRDTYPIEETTAQALKLIDGEKNLLSTVDHTHTIWGSQRLKWLLTNPYKDTERIRNRQEIVRTLSEKKGIREELTKYLEEIKDSWQRNVVSQKPPRFNITFKIALFLGIIISVIAHSQAMWGYFIIGFLIANIAFFNWLFFKLDTKQVKALAYLNDVTWSANRIKEVLETSGIDNNPEIEKLLKDLDTVNGALKELKTNISAIGELDAYLSLAELPKRFPNWKTMPEIAEPDRGVPVLDINEGYSPIISPEISQPNSVLLNGDNRVLVIGGAHGAGKSTFLRTINQLEVLGSIGSFVPAKQMRFTPVQILVSMDVQDAPGEGLSYFGKAGQFLNSLYWGSRPSYLDEKPPMYVVSFDEFLEGTNTPEARIIAEAVIKWLSEQNMPAIIVTQDTEVLKLLNAKRISRVNIAHPERAGISGKRFAYIIVPGLPDEIAICRELLKRPLNRHLRKSILKVMQGRAELEDLPAAGDIEVDSNRMVETSV